MIYWTARIFLVLLWLGVAVRAWRERGGGDRAPWRILAGIGLVLASIRAVLWNWHLLEAARALLRMAGLYEIRLRFKIVVFLGLLVGAAWVVRWYGRAVRREGGRLAVSLGIALLMAIFIMICTCSLDAVVPRVLLQQPGRYLFEGSLAVVALTAILPRRREP